MRRVARTLSPGARGVDERAAHAAEAERLRQIIKEMQRHRFGRRAETVVDVDDKAYLSCASALLLIGDDRAERLDIVPARLRVLVVRRPKYACRACEDVVVQAPAPVRLIEGGIPTEATIARVVVSPKNRLFAGADGGTEHSAILASLIETAKLNDVDTQAYITSLITRIVAGHPQSQIDQLMP